MRRSFDGLMAIIRDTYQMDPYANAVYLFCGKRKNTLKALYFDKDGLPNLPVSFIIKGKKRR